jgi:hypothetical protein
VAELVEIPNAQCIGRGVPYCRALLIRVGEEDVTLSLDDIDERSEVQKPGDHGTLVIPLWVAYGLHLVDVRSRRVA